MRSDDHLEARSSAAKQGTENRSPDDDVGRVSKRAFNALLIVIAFASLLWPLTIKGGPYFFADSIPYLRGAATGFEILFDWQSDLSESWRKPDEQAAQEAQPEPEAAGSLTTATAEGSDKNDNYVISTARSPYFGAVAFLTTEILGGWGLPAFNAAAVLTVILIATSASGFSTASGAIAIIAMSVLTPMPFYVCFFMPDVFAGLTILATAMIFACHKTLPRVVWLTIAALICMFCIFHTSHLLLLWSVAILGTLAILLRDRRLPGISLAVVALATVTTIAGQSVFQQIVERAYGSAPVSPPFLVARLIADGPGYRYLKETCGENDSVYCGYIDRMPGKEIEQGNAGWYNDMFLWGEAGIYTVAPVPIKQRMSAEHFTFAAAVFYSYPVDVTLSLLYNFWLQLQMTGLEEFNDLNEGGDLLSIIGDSVSFSQIEPSEHEIIIEHLETIAKFCFYSCFVIGFAVIFVLRRTPKANTLVVLISLVLLGLLANALITGGLSGPHDRYQARVLWLPFFLCALAYRPLRIALQS